MKVDKRFVFLLLLLLLLPSVVAYPHPISQQVDYDANNSHLIITFNGIQQEFSTASNFNVSMASSIELNDSSLSITCVNESTIDKWAERWTTGFKVDQQAWFEQTFLPEQSLKTSLNDSIKSIQLQYQQCLFQYQQLNDTYTFVNNTLTGQLQDARGQAATNRWIIILLVAGLIIVIAASIYSGYKQDPESSVGARIAEKFTKKKPQ